MLMGLAPAYATAGAGLASAGSADMVYNGAQVSVGPVAQCSLPGDSQVASQGANQPGIVSFGSAQSTCTADTAKQTTTSTATGGDFSFSALQAYGGPVITLKNYQVKCTGTADATSASWTFGGLAGVSAPAQIPSGYTVSVKSGAGALLADVIFNEAVLPSPNDGSITLRLMHIKLFPNGVPAGAKPMSGDVLVGNTACSPTT
jgi:hypothetical protein